MEKESPRLIRIDGMSLRRLRQNCAERNAIGGGGRKGGAGGGVHMMGSYKYKVRYSFVISKL
jgi:hypothetical protein